MALDYRQKATWAESNRAICSSLANEAQGECWFRVAEQSKLAKDCQRATPYQQDCFAHLLNGRLQDRFPLKQQQPSWKELTRFQQSQNDIPFKDPKVPETIAIRHWLEIPHSIDIDRCQEHERPQFCTHAATSIYRDRLRHARDKGGFPCQELPPSLRHSDTSALKLVWMEFSEVLCSR